MQWRRASLLARDAPGMGKRCGTQGLGRAFRATCSRGCTGHRTGLASHHDRHLRSPACQRGRVTPRQYMGRPTWPLGGESGRHNGAVRRSKPPGQALPPRPSHFGGPFGCPLRIRAPCVALRMPTSIRAPCVALRMPTSIRAGAHYSAAALRSTRPTALPKRSTITSASDFDLCVIEAPERTA